MKNRFQLLFALAIAMPALANAQAENEELTQTILHHDSLFWTAYNACDVESMLSYLSEDFEFYHDKNGLTNDLAVFEAGLHNGLCQEGGYRTRREPVLTSITVHPVPGHGAILDGQHLFYETPPGGTEYLSGQASFTHVWQLRDGNWKMTRVLSFGHGPAPSTVASAPSIDPTLYVGMYMGKYTGEIVIQEKAGQLELRAPSHVFTLIPKGNHEFGIANRPVRFVFVMDEAGQASAFEVWEEGQVMEKASRIP